MSDLKCFKKVDDGFVEIDLLELKKGDIFKTSIGRIDPHGAGRFFPAVEDDTQLWEATSNPFLKKGKGWTIDSEIVK